ncbi:hypothetical protein RchiOBHm_Chr3g0459951 [Rosa chinensis]|uniref:Uncharacterized protein n=1 Tax=Rosa chinensis TaxID=74649 RepID=A0A2P6R8B1_ROSCH|nr:hypothetical protein RchiOBHm_Chr3g0459951 [Rosa chinensis]
MMGEASRWGKGGGGVMATSLCALSGLMRRRSDCFVKWTNPLSSRMKPSVAGFISVQQHSWKAMLFVMMLLHDRVIFLLCYRLVKANRVASSALIANCCMLEYTGLVETPVIIRAVLSMLIVTWGLGTMFPHCILQFH